MANFSFNIELSSKADPQRSTLVSNIGRAIAKKLAVKFEGHEILSIDDFDIFACCRDLGKTKSEKKNAVRQGIISNDSCTEDCMKLRINAKDKNSAIAQDDAIAKTYGNKFIIPLDFQMLDSSVPYYQSRLRNRLSYELTFNDYDRVIISPDSPPKPDATYEIKDIALQYEIVTQPDLASHISTKYQKMALQYDRILDNRRFQVNKSDTTWTLMTIVDL